MNSNRLPDLSLGTGKEAKVKYRIRAFAISAVLIAAATALAACGGDGPAQGPTTDTTPQGVTPSDGATLMPLESIGIDPAPSDNTALSVGTIETCREVTANETFDIDVVVSGIPTDRPMQGYQVDLIYDSVLFRVLGAEPDVMLGARPDSQVVGELTEDTPSQDGRFTVAAADFGSDPGETGSGVLARITLQVQEQASTEISTPLRLEEIEIIDDNLLPIEPEEVKVTQVAIGTACP